MLNHAQLERCKQFIYRHGRLLERKRYAYHFEGGSAGAVLDVLACHQNDDGGFGHGLELDVMCPQSSPIGTEIGLSILLECEGIDSPMVDRTEAWILDNQLGSGELRNPEGAIAAYPHGGWWLGGDEMRVFSLAGLLARLGRGTDEFFGRVADLFAASYSPLPAEIGVYLYPLHLYLNHTPGADRFAAERQALRNLVPAMLETDAWHCPLFFCHDRWYSAEIADEVWRREAGKAVATLRDDGGVSIERYADMPWWRPVWTLDLLIRLRAQGLLGILDETDT